MLVNISHTNNGDVEPKFQPLNTLQMSCWNCVAYLGGFKGVVKFKYVDKILCAPA